MTDRLCMSLAPARIGNASGFRLPASFYRDRPQFVNASGWVEVLFPKMVNNGEFPDNLHELLTATQED